MSRYRLLFICITYYDIAVLMLLMSDTFCRALKTFTESKTFIFEYFITMLTLRLRAKSTCICLFITRECAMPLLLLYHDDYCWCDADDSIYIICLSRILCDNIIFYHLYLFIWHTLLYFAMPPFFDTLLHYCTFYVCFAAYSYCHHFLSTDIFFCLFMPFHTDALSEALSSPHWLATAPRHYFRHHAGFWHAAMRRRCRRGSMSPIITPYLPSRSSSIHITAHTLLLLS
jgi:hypothetical protein